MKRKLFIGSSGGRGVKIAEIVAAQFRAQCADWLDTTIWDRGNVFTPNRSTLDSLVQAAQRFHYGIFVATKDDVTAKKGNSVVEPRDNVIFEMGLFLGSMGTTRSYLLVENGTSLPSDYAGITVAYFDGDNEASIPMAIAILIQAITQTRDTFNMKPIPSATLAMGYFDNFLRVFGENYWDKYKEPGTVKVLFPMNLLSYHDKNEFNQAIDIYARLNPSEDVSVAKPGTRPVVKKFKDQLLFWDIPTTIFTLKLLFDRLPMMSELIGQNKDKEAWLSGELSEFGRALEALAATTPSYGLGIKLEVNFFVLKDGKFLETASSQL